MTVSLLVGNLLGSQVFAILKAYHIKGLGRYKYNNWLNLNENRMM